MNEPARPEPAASDLEAVLARSGRRGGLRRRLGLLGGALALGLIGAYVALSNGGTEGGPQYLTQPAVVGPLVVKVSATGNLEPTNQVDVGSELSGAIEAVLVDDDDPITRGQVLARLDLSKFQDAVAKSRAALAVSEAALLQAEATAKEAQAKLARYREVAKLSDGKVPSKTEVDTAEADLARALANEASARAGIAQSKAALQTDETNLVKAHIRSPIDGVVLERNVDPGQTVAASLQAVTLFTLAEDLTKMELEVDVDEADVGQVRAGLAATFTVDAWPGRRFQAVISRVGYAAQDTDGVISYPAVLQVVNDDLSLRPGMTGTAEITTITRDAVLLVPNAALRFAPPALTAPAKSSWTVLGSLLPRPPAATGRAKAPAPAADGSQRVWVLREGEPEPLQVKVGATDGRVTEIVGGDLQAGMLVITEILSQKR